jgi:hypothetical protein
MLLSVRLGIKLRVHPMVQGASGVFLSFGRSFVASIYPSVMNRVPTQICKQILQCASGNCRL